MSKAAAVLQCCTLRGSRKDALIDVFRYLLLLDWWWLVGWLVGWRVGLLGSQCHCHFVRERLEEKKKKENSSDEEKGGE